MVVSRIIAPVKDRQSRRFPRAARPLQRSLVFSLHQLPTLNPLSRFEDRSAQFHLI
jgi:hypothetical protein